MLDLELRRYVQAVDSQELDLAACVAESGLQCSKCGSGRCARLSSSRRRKRVTDLSTGDVFESLRIRRIVFCDGKTASLMPAELWRGKFTVTSVMEAGIHILRDGVTAAYDWCWDAGPDGSPVSLPTLARWRTLIRQRLLPAARSALGPQLGLSWSDRVPEATQLEDLLDKLSPRVLLTFRARFARSCLDQVKGGERSSRVGTRFRARRRAAR